MMPGYQSDTWDSILSGGYQQPAVPLNSIGGFTPNTMGVGDAPAGIASAGGMAGDAGAGLGWNMGTGRLALGALGTGANLWQAWNANQLAQKTFNFQRDLANTNLTNSIKSYNTQIEDRARSRAVTEGQTDAQRQEYVDRNRLSR